MGRRTLLLIAALVVAALGTVLVWLYAANADKQAQQGQQLVTVLVAKDSIAIGTNGATAYNNGSFEQKQLPQSAVPAGAISDPSSISNDVALFPIYPQQVIIQQMWGTGGQTSGLSIPKGKMAISVQLADPQRVAGFVAPGSTIAIFVTGSPTGAGGTGANLPSVKLLLKDITVLAVGPTTLASAAGNASNANSQQIPAALMTLAVNQVEAQKIIYANNAPGATYSNMTFALMNNDSEPLVIGGAGANSSNLFNAK